jgi:aspartyl-tRNA(Asn)/glutamyl-tRNA(Gln) amidotransferase subunit A
MEITSLSIKEIKDGFKKKEFSAKQVAESFLKRIEKEDKEIGSYLSVFSSEALKEAEKIDKAMAEKRELGILAGIPCGLKDNIMVEGQRCTAGSRILEKYIAPYNASVVGKLQKEQAVILGKLNLDEFAIGSSGEYSGFYPTKNPNALGCVPGGSSAGPAASVAANLCAFSLGSDTGGSIRQPAAFCGVVGLKTTYGHVSRYGLIAMASSLDQIGPITKNVEDAELVFDVIKGKDLMDSTSCDGGEVEGLKKIRIGIVKEAMGEGIDKEIKDGFNDAVSKLSKQGIEIEEVSLPYLEYGLACYYILMTAEVSSNLARYDGVKYGKRAEAPDLMKTYFKTRKEFLGKEVKRRIMLGTYCLSTGYYDAYYLRALKVRTVIADDFKNAFKKVDILMMPTTPTLPFKFGDRTNNPLSMYMADLLTVPANIAGLPAISIPYKKINDLPFGIQFIAPAFHEKDLFSLGKIFEQI